MEMAAVLNLLLFVAAFTGSLVTQSEDDDEEEDTDSLYNSGNYARTDEGDSGDDSIAADRDNLAWFLYGGDDALTGSSDRDYADLGSGNDHADMGAGNDIVEGGAGEDSVAGGTGNDLLLGDDGNDHLGGNLGDDSLSGGTGNDILAGGSGADVLTGGDGNDVISGYTTLGGAQGGMTASDGIDQLFGGNGDDQLILGRGDIASGGSGEDRFELDLRWGDGTGAMTIRDFDAEEDTLALSYIPQINPDTSLPVLPRITVETSADGESALVRVNGALVATIEGAAGLTANDIVLEPDTETDPSYAASEWDNVLQDSAGDDTLTGTEGKDYGWLDSGNDRADLGNGDDSVRGEEGNDSLDGGAGNDSLIGGDGNDQVDGGAGNDLVTGDAGADLLEGGQGADRLIGGAGDDTLSGFDESGAGGNSGAIDGVDTLSGGDGDDLLLTGRGDLATGGAGADTFALDASANEDASAVATLTDYLRATDRIEIRYTPERNAQGVEIPPVVSVIMGPSNAYAVIMFDGEPLAHVTGATTLTVADLALVRET